MAAILLQARGAGLSATFGGDSSVYRSRRGIEKRSTSSRSSLMGLVRGLLASRATARCHDHLIQRRRRVLQERPGEMRASARTIRRDILLVPLVARARASVAGRADASRSGAPRPDRQPVADGRTAERVLRRGRPSARSATLDPLFAVDPAERDAIALLFRGLVRLGPESDIRPTWRARGT